MKAMIASHELVSVIIPCYNQARFLAEAIESALQQSYPHFEVIVVDDGSTDNSLDLAARYPEVLTIQQENQGVSTARNNGVTASSGSYLVFLDSDDRLLPQALEVGMKQILDHPECAIVFGRHREIAADGSLRATSRAVAVKRDDYRSLLLGNCIITPSMAMIRRTVFSTVNGFGQNLSGAEDYDLYLRIARQFPILGHDEVVAEYRRHDANKSCNNARMLTTCLRVLRRQRAYVRGNPDWEEAYHTGIRNWRRLWGGRLVSQLWARIRERKGWKNSLEDMFVLVRYSPDVFASRLGRKLFRPLIGVPNQKDLRRSDLE